MEVMQSSRRELSTASSGPQHVVSRHTFSGLYFLPNAFFFPFKFNNILLLKLCHGAVLSVRPETTIHKTRLAILAPELWSQLFLSILTNLTFPKE